MTIHPVPKPEPTEKQARKSITRTKRLVSTSVPTRTAPMKKKTALRKVNTARMDKRRKEYKRYMASHEWKVQRVRALLAAEYACQRCGKAPDEGFTLLGVFMAAPHLHVHHKTYARFGHERVEDLEVLCESCHTAEHAGRFIQPRHRRAG